jgi:hypothetical protein
VATSSDAISLLLSTLESTRTNKRHCLQRYQQSDRPTATSDSINNHIGTTDTATSRPRHRRYRRNVSTNSEGISLLLLSLESTRTNKRHRLQRYQELDRPTTTSESINHHWNDGYRNESTKAPTLQPQRGDEQRRQFVIIIHARIDRYKQAISLTTLLTIGSTDRNERQYQSPLEGRTQKQVDRANKSGNKNTSEGRTRNLGRRHFSLFP